MCYPPAQPRQDRAAVWDVVETSVKLRQDQVSITVASMAKLTLCSLFAKPVSPFEAWSKLL